MNKALSKMLVWFSLGVLALISSGYIYIRQVGVEITTSSDSFVIPARDNLTFDLPDGGVQTIIEITPAPWPSEARLIHRLAKFGIPVQIELKHAGGYFGFSIVGVDGDGYLVVRSVTKAHADFMLRLLGATGR